MDIHRVTQHHSSTRENMSLNTTIQCIIVAAVFLVGVFLGSLDGCTTEDPHRHRSTLVRVVDTQYVVSTYPVEKIVRVPGEVRYRDTGRTTIVPDPCLDTLIASRTFTFGNDSVHVSYETCTNLWDASFWRSPDTAKIITVRDSVTVYESVPDTKLWGVGLFAGYTMGVDDLDKPVLAPSHLRIGIGITYRIVGW